MELEPGPRGVSPEQQHDPEDSVLWSDIRPYYHVGAYPQRPIVPSEQETDEDDTTQPMVAARATARGPVLLDPEHPEQGVLYTGPTAAEELALARGGTVEEAEAVVNGPRERVKALREEQAERRAAGEPRPRLRDPRTPGVRAPEVVPLEERVALSTTPDASEREARTRTEREAPARSRTHDAPDKS